MSTLRISTKDSNRAVSLRDYLSQHGLNVTMLSSTELEIEGSDLSEELRTEISSWRHAQDLEITVDALPQDAMEPSEPGEQSDDEWGEFEAPQREFILAPHWRRARTHFAGLGAALSAGAEWTRSAFGRVSAWLRETEEKILARSRKSEQEQKIAEEQIWAETVRPIESIHRSEATRSAAIPMREKIRSAAAFLTAFNSRIRFTEGGKAVAFAGGVVMAGLIGIGLSVSHVDKTYAAPLHPAAVSNPVSANVVETNAQPEHHVKSATPVQREAVPISKPSPVVSVQTARRQHRSAEVVVHRYQNDASDDESSDVVTHYYHQKAAVSQLQKTTYKGVKHYSDMD